ncbi:MAG TPA: hypothetical protein GXX48_07270, partial [Ochrobactrum intermedium]|nr:hypothetical protein [Brucella intermedia]
MSDCLNLLYSKRKTAHGGGSLLSAIMLAVSAVPSVAQDLDPQTHIPQLQTTTTGLPDLPQPALNLPTLNNYASPSSPENNPLAQTRELDLKARLSEGGGDIPAGLVWRVFSPDVGADGQLPLIASAQGGGAVFNLPEGSYLVHVAYGRAGAT